MDDAILITELNDFIFCPASIYFHKLYGSMDKMLYQSTAQINGSAAHKAVDENQYSSSSDIITALDVYCEQYNLIGKIDIYDKRKKILRERKKLVKQIYDGYIFQIYAQYFAMIEMGYEIEKLEIYSIDDHKHYMINLPSEDSEMFEKFLKVIDRINRFSLDEFTQTNKLKCQNCIYEPSCDKSLA